MREILFRGKRVDNGEWAYGYFVLQGNESYIFEQREVDKGIDLGGYLDCCQMCEAIPETIGQYTGLKDKNGMKIFEGDIVGTRKDAIYTKKLKGYYGFDSEGYPQKIPGYEGESEYHYSCQVECCALVEFSPRHGYYLRGTTTFVDAICNEVVGNIHDNPELLEGK